MPRIYNYLLDLLTQMLARLRLANFIPFRVKKPRRRAASSAFFALSADRQA